MHLLDKESPDRSGGRRRLLARGLGLLGSWLGAVWEVTAQTGPIEDAWPGRLSGVLLARVADPDIDPTGYLVSEKFDGVRALWDGRTLRSRSGRTLAAPADFLARLPPVALDGELWLGHGRFDEVSALVRRRRSRPGDWAQVQYLVFELPWGAGRFDERAGRIRQIVEAAGWAQLRAVDQAVVEDRTALQVRLQTVIEAGGEGLMLHQADAPHVSGRSDTLLKLKPVHDDEALVIGHTAGQGRYRGMLGALQVRNADGVAFLVGSGLSDRERLHPPSVGSRIIYSSRGQTSYGVPRFATFVRMSDEP
jgi:DNA ligase-1